MSVLTLGRALMGDVKTGLAVTNASPASQVSVPKMECVMVRYRVWAPTQGFVQSKLHGSALELMFSGSILPQNLGNKNKQHSDFGYMPKAFP